MLHSNSKYTTCFINKIIEATAIFKYINFKKNLLNKNLPTPFVYFLTERHLITEHLNGSVMKTINYNQEILLMPTARFFNKDWMEKNIQNGSKKLSQKEQLIELCWNGMLPEILPEINEKTNNNKPLTLWEINETDHLIDLRLGSFDDSLLDEHSINPYVIIELASVN